MRKSNITTLKMKVFQKGQVVIPVSLIKAYNINIGDQLEVIPASQGILLKPVPEEKPHETLTDQLYGIFSLYAAKQASVRKADIQTATDRGFTEEWTE